MFPGVGTINILFYYFHFLLTEHTESNHYYNMAFRIYNDKFNT